MALIKENPNYTYPKIAAALRLSEKTIEKHMRILQQHGIVVRDGANRGGRWKVKIED